LHFVFGFAHMSAVLLTAAVCGGMPVHAAGAYRVYVTNELSGDLSIIDGATHDVIATVPLGKRPRGIQMSPDGRYLYVALSGSPLAPPGTDETTLPPADKSADGIGVFSIAARRIERVITGVSDPEQLAVGMRGERLFIASEDTGTAVIADARDGTIYGSLPVGGEPEGVAVSPDGSFVYMTSESDNRVTVIDTEAGVVAAQFDVGVRPRAVAFAADGSRAYVPGELDASVAVVDAREHAVIAMIDVPGEHALPMGVAVTRDGDTVYVTTGRGRTLVAIDAATHALIGSVEVGIRPWGVALGTDERYAYTANGPSDDVSVVDTATMSVIKTIAVGTRPWGVAVVPD
jgi:YVTN family beta-propeller protein